MAQRLLRAVCVSGDRVSDGFAKRRLARSRNGRAKNCVSKRRHSVAKRGGARLWHGHEMRSKARRWHCNAEFGRGTEWLRSDLHSDGIAVRRKALAAARPSKVPQRNGNDTGSTAGAKYGTVWL